MPYGRLDVFWPDGQFQTFTLTDPTITIGRSSGSTLTLETTSISRYHCTFTYDGEQVAVTDMDSANGTFVDGVKLAGNTPQNLYGGEEIQIGELRMVYCDLDNSPTRPMLVPEDTTQRIELEAPAFRIEVKGPFQPVSPGAHIAAELVVQNTGRETERYIVEVIGLPQDWVRLDRPLLAIDPGKTDSVIISFKPLRRSDSTPGDYPVMIVVRPNRESVTMLKADVNLHVLPFGGFGMALEKRRLADDGVFRVHLHNQGSAPLPLAVSAANASEALNVTFSTPKITLAAGQRATVQGTVRPARKPLFGEPVQYPFDVMVRALDPSGFVAASRAYTTVAPSLPRWAPLALAGGALAALVLLFALGAALVSSGTRPQPPVISSLTVNSTQIAQGDPLVVNWAADNVSTLRLLLNGTQVYSGNDDLPTSYTVNTSDLAGSVLIAVEAGNGTDMATQEARVLVLNPMRVETFTVTPTRLIRNVVQPITVEWNVSGATATRLSGLSSFTTTPIDEAYGAQGVLTNIVGIPEQPLSLTLSAEAEDGSALEQSIMVEVIDPVCSAAGDAVSLRAAPREDEQVVGTVPTDTMVIVDGQDETRQWLRVMLSGGVAGWGPRTAFDCDALFNVGDLRQILNVSTPVPTAPPTAAPTATPEPLITATPRRTASPARTAAPAPTRTTAPPTQAAPTILPGP